MEGGGGFILPSLTEREKKEERRNKAMGVDVRRIIEQAIKPATYSHSLLSKLTLIGQTDKDGNSVLTAVKSRYNLKWGSVKAHLVSFGHFVKFMQATRPDWWDEEVVAKIDGVQKRCFTNVCKLHTVEDFDRKRNEMGSEIEPEQFASVLSSNELSGTLSYLNKLRPMMDTGNVREAVYNEHMSRLILCVQMTWQDDKRSRILAEMKKSDVSNAKLVDNVFVAHVSSGKTMKSYGPSNVVFSKEVHSAMRSLGKMDRCLDRCTEHCFNAFHGSALTAKQITTSLKQRPNVEHLHVLLNLSSDDATSQGSRLHEASESTDTLHSTDKWEEKWHPHRSSKVWSEQRKDCARHESRICVIREDRADVWTK